MSSNAKSASEHTTAGNAAVAVSFDDPGDHDRATRGLLAQLDGPLTVGDHTVFDVARHAFVSENETSPASVHPGLWRQARLNKHHGLFEVAEGIWQVRGYDVSNITFMAGTDGGWLVIDPLTNAVCAAAALDLANRTLGERPVTSVIYTHSHVDHFGGVLGVTSAEAVEKGDVQIVAPVGFIEEIVGEFVIAGPIMRRRAAYQFGPLLEPGPLGHVDCGLGPARAMAPSALLAPTRTIERTGEEMQLSGIDIVFQNTPDAEAPAEMNFFFPGKGLLCMAENCTHTLHNLYPIRGAQVRNALAWSKYIQEAIDLWADDTDVMFASHHWPRFGREDVRSFLEMQRDVYRWMHDQTMRLANDGWRPTEIAAELALPDEFNQSHVQGYYGTVSHNVRSVYNRYLGWYDGNPATLDPLPPSDAGSRYVDLAGGAEALMVKAQTAFDEGDYRWVAEIVNHLVFADPSNEAARALQADALEQLGYQSESATWRNAYLMGAKELREGSPAQGAVPNHSMSDAMRAEHLFDLAGVLFDPSRFEHDSFTANIHFTDLGEDHVLGIGRSAVHHRPDTVDDDAVVSWSVSRTAFSEALADPSSVATDAVTGNADALQAFLTSLVSFGTATLIEPRPQD